MRKYLILIVIAICFVSCTNYYEAIRITKHFPREYTGIDTLIRIDGYYYHEASILSMPEQYLRGHQIDEDRIVLESPFKIFNNREWLILFVCNASHNSMQEAIKNNGYFCDGNYFLSGDTIIARFATRYALGLDNEIYLRKYLIENDTTLRLVWGSCETCQTSDGKKHDSASNIKNDIYKFFKYPVNPVLRNQ